MRSSPRPASTNTPPAGQHLRHALDVSADDITVFDRHSRPMLINQAARRADGEQEPVDLDRETECTLKLRAAVVGQSTKPGHRAQHRGPAASRRDKL